MISDLTKGLRGRRRHTQPKCSFCASEHPGYRELIAGSEDVFVCYKCIELCSEIVEEERNQGRA